MTRLPRHLRRRVAEESSEVWLPAPGHPDYEVSNLGRVRGVPRVVVRSDGRRQSIPGGIMRQFLDDTGRPKVGLRRNGRPGRSVRVHSLVITAFVGPRPEGMECCHNDGNPLNNRLGNLRWDTKSANLLDRVRHGAHHEASKTHCKHGHPFDEQNTRLRANGLWRACHACLQRRRNEARARKRAA